MYLLLPNTSVTLIFITKNHDIVIKNSCHYYSSYGHIKFLLLYELISLDRWLIYTYLEEGTRAYMFTLDRS